MKTNKLGRSLAALGALLAVVGVVVAAQPVHADSFNVQLAVEAGCINKTDGVASKGVTVTTGSTVSVTVLNTDTITSQNVSGPGVAGGTQIPANTKTTNSEMAFNLGAINSVTTLTFTPVPRDTTGEYLQSTNYCPLGSSPTASTLTVTPVAAPASSSPQTTTVAPKPTAPTPSTTTKPADTAKTDDKKSGQTKSAALSSAQKESVQEETAKSRAWLWILLAVLLLTVAMGLFGPKRVAFLKRFTKNKKKSVKKKSRR